VIKRYFDKFKMQKKSREEILAAAEDSEDFVKRMMGKEYVHFTEAIPEIKQFLIELEKKESEKKEEKAAKMGAKLGQLVNVQSVLAEVSPKKKQKKAAE
jgi:glycerol-3-phosphate O-acyltransferase